VEHEENVDARSHQDCLDRDETRRIQAVPPERRTPVRGARFSGINAPIWKSALQPRRTVAK
jgi:hypothetical protein